MRGQARRAWIKVYITGYLHGSVRWQLDPEERSVWIDILCLAGECNKDGRICDNDGRPFPLSFIASQLHITQELLESTLKKCKYEGRIDDKDGVITVTNWSVYQSEYQRQLPYRKKGPDAKNPDRFIEGDYGHMVKR